MTIQAKARQTSALEVVSEGADVFIKAFRDGSLATVDFIAALSASGRVFVANGGTVTTPITFGAGVIDNTEFDLHVAVPTNATIIPLEIILHIESWGTAAIFEFMAQYGTDSVVGANGTAVTPTNVNTQSSRASACTIKSNADAAGTAFTARATEFWRGGMQRVQDIATTTDVEHRQGHTYPWSWKTSGVLHFIGPSAQLAVYAGAQAGTGFITLVYAETESSWWA